MVFAYSKYNNGTEKKTKNILIAQLIFILAKFIIQNKKQIEQKHLRILDQ